tara:strand:+ start:827 stop:1576 length:750 start_codon:yes stop_codon:yes gene_type:complete
MKLINYFLYACFFMLISNMTIARELKSNVIVLVDFSNSYYTPDRKKIDIPQNIKKLTNIIASKRNGPKKPSLIQLLPIDSLSQQGKPICEYMLARKGLMMGSSEKSCENYNEGHCSTKPKLFKSYMNKICKKYINSTPVSGQTDIQGALSLASQLGTSQTDATKYLVIFSDMFEYRNSKIPVTKVNLTNFHVLVVCGGQVNSEENVAKFCMGLENKWKSALSDLGAESVAFTIETGKWDLKVAKEFFSK